MRWNKRVGFFLSVAVVLLILFGMAYKSTAALMGGPIQGSQINVEPATCILYLRGNSA